MREAAAGVAVLLLLGGVAWLRPLPDRAVPPPVPAQDCRPWMTDAIQGVGPRTREMVAAQVRAGRVPAEARTWFAVAP